MVSSFSNSGYGIEPCFKELPRVSISIVCPDSFLLGEDPFTGCGGLRFGLSEFSCFCGDVLETVKFSVVEVYILPVFGIVYVFFFCRSGGCGSRFGYLLSK